MPPKVEKKFTQSKYQAVVVWKNFLSLIAINANYVKGSTDNENGNKNSTFNTFTILVGEFVSKHGIFQDSNDYDIGDFSDKEMRMHSNNTFANSENVWIKGIIKSTQAI